MRQFVSKFIYLIALLAALIVCQKADGILPGVNPFSSQAPSQITTVTSSIPHQPHTNSPLYLAKSPPKNWTSLVDILTINPHIILDLRYATNNNFLKRKLYPIKRCFLRYPVAQRLAKVQTDLEKQGLGIKLYDCYRPLSIQKQMWRAFPNPRYLANPLKGSRHNRGAAVDLTLVDLDGNELEMPTGFDNFTRRSHRNYRGVSRRAKRNSQLLERVMIKHGFTPISTEWWHFDARDWRKFSILNIPLNSIS